MEGAKMKPGNTKNRSRALGVTGSLLLVFGWLPACGGGGSGPTEPDQPGVANGNLEILLVDAPADEICELWVYIEDLRVKPDGEPPVSLGGDPIGLVELLALRDGPPALLVDAGVEQRRYQFIEILLDQDQSFVVESASDDPANPVCPGDVVDLQIPSEKFKVTGGPFDVTANTAVTIDFDAAKSLKRKGSSNNPKGWMLNPDVSIVEVQ